jgi:hypothetical protein
MRNYGATPVFMGIMFCSIALADANTSLELSLNGIRAKGSLFLVSLGIQVDHTPVALKIGVRNTSNVGQTLDVFKTSSNLDVQWAAPNDKFGLITRSTLQPGDEQILAIKIMPTAMDMTTAPTIALLSGGQNAASVAFSYRIDLPEKTRKTGGEYWTYRGLEGQRMLPRVHYELCTGAAPLGYHLDASSIRITSQTVAGGHQRSCGAWMVCTPEPVSNGNVCFTFDIEGHWRGGNLTRGDENDALKVALGLQATYVLDEPTFVLGLLAEPSKR